MWHRALPKLGKISSAQPCGDSGASSGYSWQRSHLCHAISLQQWRYPGQNEQWQCTLLPPAPWAASTGCTPSLLEKTQSWRQEGRSGWQLAACWPAAKLAKIAGGKRGTAGGRRGRQSDRWRSTAREQALPRRTMLQGCSSPLGEHVARDRDCLYGVTLCVE